MERDNWKTIADNLRKRWDGEKKPEVRHELAQPLVRILSWLGPEQALPFLRVQLNSATDQYRVEYANQLFNTLISQKWSIEFEDEAFALFDKLADADAPAGGLAIRVAALYRLDDAMLEGRYQAPMKTVDHPEKLTRPPICEPSKTSFASWHAKALPIAWAKKRSGILGRSSVGWLSNGSGWTRSSTATWIGWPMSAGNC